MSYIKYQIELKKLWTKINLVRFEAEQNYLNLEAHIQDREESTHAYKKLDPKFDKLEEAITKSTKAYRGVIGILIILIGGITLKNE